MWERERNIRASELVEKMHSFLVEEYRVSIKTISTQFGVGVIAVHRIIPGYLNMHKICAKFISRVLSDEQKEIRFDNSREIATGQQNCSSSYLQPTPYTL